MLGHLKVMPDTQAALISRQRTLRPATRPRLGPVRLQRSEPALTTKRLVPRPHRHPMLQTPGRHAPS
jgi:hypothetical protein